MQIKLSDIYIPIRQRKLMDQGKLLELARDIETNGLYHPIVVRAPFEPEKEAAGARPFVLSIGGRRLAAHHVLKRETIEANVKELMSPVQAEVIELHENLQRENISWQDEVDARARIYELQSGSAEFVKNSRGATILKSLGVKDVAESIGVDPATLSRDLALSKALKADPTLRLANSKGSAMRAATYRKDIAERASAAAKNPTSLLLQKLATADGRDFIRTIPSRSIDLVFSDLPYGIDYFGTLKEGTGAGSSHSVYDDTADAAKDFIADIVPEAVRVVKPSGWIVFFMCYEWHDWLQTQIRTTCRAHGQYLIDVNGCSRYRSEDSCFTLTPELPPWLWTRRGKGNHGHWPELHASNRYEMLVVVNGGEAKLAKKPVENVLDFPPFSDERLHAMQKPHELCREIIERTTVVGEKVLDICFGSGAHLAAAASMGRDFLGCDNNPANLESALVLVSKHYDLESQAALARARGEKA